MEQILDWLNENELRAYPLCAFSDKTIQTQADSWTLPDDFLLDLQLVITNFSLSQNDGTSVGVFLKSLKYTNPDSLEVTFGSLEDDTVSFSLTNTGSPQLPYYVRDSSGSLAVFGQGLLTVIANFAETSQEVPLTLAVEPSVCLQFNQAWLGVSNLRASPEKESKSVLEEGEAKSYEPALPLVPVAEPTALTGDVKFLEGYNFKVDMSLGTIDLEASRNRGLRMSCATSFIPEEYLDCGELVSYINGVPPDASGTFKLNPGSNIDIVGGQTLSNFNDSLTESANSHTLFVGLTFQATDLCAPVNITPVI
jgi:hypothetical protein